MKALKLMPAHEILQIREAMSITTLNKPKQISEPGSNPWVKYIIVAGVIVVIMIIAYHITKPRNYEFKSVPEKANA